MRRELSNASAPDLSFPQRSHFYFGSHTRPYRRKNPLFLFMHLRGAHFATLLFSHSCMEWGVCTPHQEKEQLMSTTIISSSSIGDPVVVPSQSASSRCPYLYPNGKRCSLPGLPAHSGFCLGHSQTIAPTVFPVNVQDDSEDLTAELLPELSQFNTGVDINKFLARLLKLVTEGAISPRRASVLAYIANQLLHPPRRRP